MNEKDEWPTAEERTARIRVKIFRAHHMARCSGLRIAMACHRAAIRSSRLSETAYLPRREKL